MSLPALKVPAALAWLHQRLPQRPPTWLLAQALNLGRKRWIDDECFEPLLGKRFAIKVSDAGLDLRFVYTPSGFIPDDQGPVDLSVTATARDFLALLNKEEDPDTLFFSRRLLTEGDTDLGLLVKNTLDALDLPILDPHRPWAFIQACRARWSQPLPEQAR